MNVRLLWLTIEKFLSVGQRNMALLPNTPVASGERIPLEETGDRWQVTARMHFPKSLLSPVIRLQKYPFLHGRFKVHLDSHITSLWLFFHCPEEWLSREKLKESDHKK